MVSKHAILRHPKLFYQAILDEHHNNKEEWFFDQTGALMLEYMWPYIFVENWNDPPTEWGGGDSLEEICKVVVGGCNATWTDNNLSSGDAAAAKIGYPCGAYR